MFNKKLLRVGYLFQLFPKIFIGGCNQYLKAFSFQILDQIFPSLAIQFARNVVNENNRIRGKLIPKKLNIGKYKAQKGHFLLTQRTEFKRIESIKAKNEVIPVDSYLRNSGFYINRFLVTIEVIDLLLIPMDEHTIQI